MKTILSVSLLFITAICSAQTETTNELDHTYSSRTFFLYNNTLRMINQKGDKDFDELIKDIEKMKVVWVNKQEKKFGPQQYKKLVSSYKAEEFEEIMNTRYENKSFNAYIKEKNGDTKGVVVTVDDGENVYVMDIVGKVALNKITSLFSSLNNNSDIGLKIKDMMNKEGQ
jgi:Domain of unknown function (DUF4252)